MYSTQIYQVLEIILSMQLLEHAHIPFLLTSVFPGFRRFILFRSIFTDLEAYQGWKQESWVSRSDIIISVTIELKV